MKYLFSLIILFTGLLFLHSCTKTESDFSENRQETIAINASTLNTATGIAVSFLVTSSLNNNNVTAESKVYVNGSVITGNSFTFSNAGTFAVYATKGLLTSNVVTVTVTSIIANSGYKHKVLVEEYSGTWCGNCPRILYGVDLLHLQTEQAVVVSTHLFSSDPFITTDGNNLAASQGVSGVPTGNINRTVSWNGPQYENVNQVINTIQASSTVGLAINSTINNNTLQVNIKVGYAQPLNAGAKLTVYLVEDKLLHTQRNYSSNLYGGQATVPNFEYNGVLRKVISAIDGDEVASTGNSTEKNYSLTLPANISSMANTKIVAFITNLSKTVVNVQQAKVGENKAFEIL